MKSIRAAGIIIAVCIMALLCAPGLAEDEGWMSDYLISPSADTVLDYMETQQLFAALSDKTLLAASGAGAWEGKLNVDAGGGFEGYYYDEDAGDEVVYVVSFSGHFAPNAEVHGQTYWLWVGELATQNTPGTEAVTTYGERVVYTEAPFHENGYMVLTLIDTPAAEIPETVKGEIGGTTGEWDNYDRFVTLTRQEDGWGYFADGYETSREELVPVIDIAQAPEGKTAPIPQSESEDPTTPVPEGTPAGTDAGLAGYWMTGDSTGGELVITAGGDGTLHMKAFFLRTFDLEADLAWTDGSHYAFKTPYGHYTGRLSREADGTLRFAVTGGLSMEDDESEMYYFFHDREYIFRPAAYEDVWYELPAEGPEDDADWLGEWTARVGGMTSVIRIEPGAYGDYMMHLSFSTGYSVSGPLERSDSRTMDFVTDDFTAMLTLNRKKHAIIMSEVGSMSDDAYRWLDAAGYAVEYLAGQPAEDQPDPAPEQGSGQEEDTAGADAGLIPVNGKPGYMQVPVARVDATSYIVGKDPSAYIPFRMIDGAETTAFQFSAKDTPPGSAYLYFDFGGPYTLDEMWIKNGFWKTTDGKDQYLRNCRVKSMTVEFRDAESGEYKNAFPVFLADDRQRSGWTVIATGRRTNVTGIRIRIDEIYEGSKFKNDVCISEIMFVKKTD